MYNDELLYVTLSPFLQILEMEIRWWQGRTHIFFRSKLFVVYSEV